MNDFKLGWNQDLPRTRAAMPRMENYLIDQDYQDLLAKVPAQNAYSNAVAKAGGYSMHLNDQLGCCTIATAANLIQTFSANAAHMLVVPDVQVKAQYFALTGGADNGLMMDEVYKAWLAKGFFMSDLRYSDKILAWTTLDPGKDDLVRFASYYFGGLIYGVCLPETANWQIKKGLPWDYIDKPTAEQGSNEESSWGGHSIHVPDFAAFGETCTTWQILQPMTKAFRQKYVDFAAVIIDLNWFNAVHKTPAMGLAYKDLVSDMAKYLKAA